MRRNYGLAAGILAGLVLSGAASADSVWRVSSPYPGNPFRVAVLDGRGQAGVLAFRVSLELSCHPDAAVPRAVLRVPADISGWNWRDYEGGADGQDQRMHSLEVRSRNTRILDRPRFTGILEDDTSFLFSWQPNEAFLSQVGAAAREVSISLDGRLRSQGAVTAVFDFPVGATTMLAALGPCSKSIAVRRRVQSGASDEEPVDVYNDPALDDQRY
jgi:hypothetical protein